MPRLRVSVEAADDVAAIANWIKRERPSAARRVGQKLRKTFQFLAENPDAGQICDDVRPGMRVFVPGAPASRYLIFYQRQVSPDIVEISAVINGARDWPHSRRSVAARLSYRALGQ